MGYDCGGEEAGKVATIIQISLTIATYICRDILQLICFSLCCRYQGIGVRPPCFPMTWRFLRPCRTASVLTMLLTHRTYLTLEVGANDWTCWYCCKLYTEFRIADHGAQILTKLPDFCNWRRCFWISHLDIDPTAIVVANTRSEFWPCAAGAGRKEKRPRASRTPASGSTRRSVASFADYDDSEDEEATSPDKYSTGEFLAGDILVSLQSAHACVCMCTELYRKIASVQAFRALE